MLTTKEAARRLGVRPCDLQSWRNRGIGPPWTRAHGRIYYDLADLLDRSTWTESEEKVDLVARYRRKLVLRWRDDLGWSFKQIAEALGVSYSRGRQLYYSAEPYAREEARKK